MLNAADVRLLISESTTLQTCYPWCWGCTNHFFKFSSSNFCFFVTPVSPTKMQQLPYFLEPFKLHAFIYLFFFPAWQENLLIHFTNGPALLEAYKLGVKVWWNAVVDTDEQRLENGDMKGAELFLWRQQDGSQFKAAFTFPQPLTATILKETHLYVKSFKGRKFEAIEKTAEERLNLKCMI